MVCARDLCTADKLFIFINITFAMYSGVLLATAARLAWDPSTYTWLRYLLLAQYRVSLAYLLTAGLWIAALVYIAAASAHRAARKSLYTYAAGVVCLAVSEVAYGVWMVVSLVDWWHNDPRAEMARSGMDLLLNFKKILLDLNYYRDIAHAIYDMIMEVEHKSLNNVYVIIVFVGFGVVLQIAAFIMAWRLARRGGEPVPAHARETEPCTCTCEKRDDDSDSDARSPSDWRKNANLRMYTILDKIF